MLVGLVIQMEVLFVNLYTTNQISTRKYNRKNTIAFLVFFTFVTVILFGILKTDNTPDWANLLVGLSFLLPLSILYQASTIRMSTIMFFCWTQTMIISNISKYLGLIINPDFPVLHVGIQTILFIIAFPLIQKFTKSTIKVILDGISDESFFYLIVLGTLLLSLAVIFSYFLTSYFVIILLLVLLGITNISVYVLLRNFVRESNKVISLNKIAFTDSLTKIDNRFSLFASVKILIEDNTPFHCMFMDLDNFKSINDQFGHTYGDSYLIDFTKAVNNSISSNSTLYRMAGDEFVCISSDEHMDISKLMIQINDNFISEHQFLGVSIGYSSFPADGKHLDDLLLAADAKMYKSKHNTNIRHKKR